MQMSLMFPQIEAHMLGLCIIIYGASKFCEPIYGLLCDHWVSPLGRRLPLLLIANAAALISLCTMAYSTLDNARGNLFMCGFVSCMFAINVAEVAYHGILADETDLRPRSNGILSGYKTAWFIGGAACVQGATILGFSTFSIYVAQAVSVPFFLGLTAVSMRVLPSLPSDPPFKLTLRAAANSYKLSPASHGVFFWVIVAYFFVTAGTQWERYLFFFVRDCISPSVPLARVHASRAYMACLVACASGAVCYSAFACTRRFGNRLCFMFSSILLACFTSTLIVVETPSQLYVAIVAVGVATGVMISSSFALALEHIPHNELESLRSDVVTISHCCVSSPLQLACRYILPPHLLMRNVQHVRVPRLRLRHGAPDHVGAVTRPFWQPNERQRSWVRATGPPRCHPALSRCQVANGLRVPCILLRRHVTLRQVSSLWLHGCISLWLCHVVDKCRCDEMAN